MPGSKKEIDELSERTEKFKKSFEILKKFYKAFEYPFSFIDSKYEDTDEINESYQLKNIIIMIFNKNMKKENMNIKYFNFPKNIIEVYWYEEG